MTAAEHGLACVLAPASYVSLLKPRRCTTYHRHNSCHSLSPTTLLHHKTKAKKLFGLRNCQSITRTSQKTISVKDTRMISTNNSYGDRSFSAAGPKVWNKLPPGLRQPGLLFSTFQKHLKTHLFQQTATA